MSAARQWRRARPDRSWIVFSLVTACLVGEPAPGGTVATTTVTTYQYNDDGAPTAITTQVGSAAATIQYLSWDNFVPDSDDPTSGSVSSANGNLSGSGSAPGAASTALSFDRRNRLTGYSAGNLGVSYAYHPDGTLESASVDGDGWLFYHGAAAARRVRNVCQQSTAECSAWLDDLRHVSDGSDDALMNPRKDVAASYDASADTVAPYRYDAFGAEPEATTSATYDLGDNPFRFAGELRDPVSGAYYLRARWYVPDVPSFVARDPLAHLNRYGYADGNPVMNVDPTGMRSRSIFDDLREGLEWLDSGVQGHLARLFLAPALGALEIIANPKSFWESLETNYEGSDVYFALGIAGQIASSGLFSLGAEATSLVGYGARALSGTQVVTTSIHHGKLDGNDLLESSEELVGNLAYETAFERMHESREETGQSSEANLDPWSRATKLANSAREAADRVRISTRHRARLDRTVKARAAARAASSSDSSDQPAGARLLSSSEPQRAQALPASDNTWAATGTTLSRSSRQQTSVDVDVGAGASRAVTPPSNECRESVREVLDLLRGS